MVERLSWKAPPESSQIPGGYPGEMGEDSPGAAGCRGLAHLGLSCSRHGAACAGRTPDYDPGRDLDGGGSAIADPEENQDRD